MQGIKVVCSLAGLSVWIALSSNSQAVPTQPLAISSENELSRSQFAFSPAVQPTRLSVGVTTTLSPLWSSGLRAQVPPPSERFPQPQPDISPLPGSPESPPANQPTPAEPPVDIPTDVFVETIQITGSTVFETAELQAVVAPFEGQSLTAQQLVQVADAVTQLYLQNGYITTRAVLAEQVITGGILEIQVFEGGIEAIAIEGNRNLKDPFIRDRIARVTEAPLNQIILEEQLRLLQLHPLIETIEASLQAGDEQGSSVLTVLVEETSPVVGQLSFDNYSPNTVGSNRLGGEIGYLSPSGFGDEVSASVFISTTGGSEVYNVGYRVPVNALDGTLQLGYTKTNFEITDPETNFGLDIGGDTDIYTVSFRQPLIRSLREEFALSFGFRRREGETLISDILIDSSDTSVLQFGQDYLRRGANGAWSLRSQFSFGANLFEITDLPDNQPDGEFFSWLGQVQRVQVLGDRQTLVLQGDLQLSTDPLLPSEQFILGGGQSLRGYEQNTLFGDNGFRFSIEDRIALDRNAAGRSTIQVAPFIDLGVAWNNDDSPSEIDENFLMGLGAGLLWEPLPGFSTRLDFAAPLISSDDNEEAFFFSVIYRP